MEVGPETLAQCFCLSSLCFLTWEAADQQPHAPATGPSASQWTVSFLKQESKHVSPQFAFVMCFLMAFLTAVLPGPPGRLLWFSLY